MQYIQGWNQPPHQHRIRQVSVELRDKYFELYENIKSPSVLVSPPQITGNVRENMKMPLHKFNIKFRFYLHTMNLYDEFNLFMKIVQRSSGLEVLKFIFQNNLS